MRIDLLVPELAPHDATGTHTLLLRDLLVEQGATVRFVTQVPTQVVRRLSLLRTGVTPPRPSSCSTASDHSWPTP